MEDPRYSYEKHILLGVEAERQRCLDFLNAARNGEIDNDLRTLIDFVSSDETLEDFLKEF